MEELSFQCEVYKSTASELWIGRCRELRICTQGTSEKDAKLAVAEAIAIRLTAPKRLRKGTKYVSIPLSLVAEANLASNSVHPT